MDFNNFTYLDVRQIGFMYNYIQSVVPFVYDRSLDLFTLLSKLINYANEIGERNNDLAKTFDSLVEYVNKSEKEQIDFINNFVAQLRKEFEDWKVLYNKKYDTFTKEQIANYNQFVNEIENTLISFETNINNIVDQFKLEINTQETNFENTINENQANYEATTNAQIETWKEEIDQAITNLQDSITEINNNYNTRFTNFETTTNDTLEQYNTELNNQLMEVEQNINTLINQTTQEIENKISDTNLAPVVNQEITKLINDGSVANGLQNVYGSIIRITYWNTEVPPTVESKEPVYHFNPNTNILTDCRNGNIIPILTNSIYIYNGYVYIAKIVEDTTRLILETILGSGDSGCLKIGSSQNGRYILFAEAGYRNVYAYDTTENTFRKVFETNDLNSWLACGQIVVINNDLTEIIFSSQTANYSLCYATINTGSVNLSINVTTTDIPCYSVVAIDNKIYFQRDRRIFETDFDNVKTLSDTNLPQPIFSAPSTFSNYAILKNSKGWFLCGWQNSYLYVYDNTANELRSVSSSSGGNLPRYTYFTITEEKIYCIDVSNRNRGTIYEYSINSGQNEGYTTYNTSEKTFAIFDNILYIIKQENGQTVMYNTNKYKQETGEPIPLDVPFANYNGTGQANGINYLVGRDNQAFFTYNKIKQNLEEINYERKSV